MLVSYTLNPVHRLTWDDTIDRHIPWSLISATITKEVMDGACLLDSATMTVSAPIGYEFPEGWYRLVANITAGFEKTRHALGTFWVYPTGDEIRNGHLVISLNASSSLTPLAEREILTGDFVSKGASAAEKVARLIREATPAPVSVLGDFTLNDYYVFDPGTTYLDVVWGLIRKAGWCLQLQPDGRVVVREKPETPSYIINRETRDVVKQGVRRTFNRSDIPNRLKVIDRYGGEYVVENHQAGSRTSYEARGRWIDAVDTAPQPKDGETIPAYAKRQLEQLSTVSYLHTFAMDWVDNLVPFDLVQALLPNDGLMGDLRITRQQITCGNSRLKVDVTAGYEVKEYVA